MAGSWTEPTRLLIGAHPPGVGGLWSLLHTAELAVMHLAMDSRRDVDLVFTCAAIDLREAVEELEWHYPALPEATGFLDLGRAPADDVDGECEQALTGLLDAALGLAGELLQDPAGDLAEVLALARVATLSVSAYQHLTGGLP